MNNNLENDNEITKILDNNFINKYFNNIYNKNLIHNQKNIETLIQYKNGIFTYLFEKNEKFLIVIKKVK